MGDLVGMILCLIFVIFTYKKIIKPSLEDENSYRNLLIRKTELEMAKLEMELLERKEVK